MIHGVHLKQDKNVNIKGHIIFQYGEYYGIRGQQYLSQPLRSKVEDQSLLEKYLSINTHIHPNILN